MKQWAEMTDREVNAHKAKVCAHCKYLVRYGGKEGWASKTICNYMDVEGHMRPCSPLQCVEMGVFRAKKRKKE